MLHQTQNVLPSPPRAPPVLPCLLHTSWVVHTSVLYASLHLGCSPPFLPYWRELSRVPFSSSIPCDPSLSSWDLLGKITFLGLPSWTEQSRNAYQVFLDAGFCRDTFPSWQDNKLIILIMCSSCTIPTPGWLLCFIIETPQGIVNRKCLMRFKRLGFCF